MSAGADWFETTPQDRRERAMELGAEIAKEHEDFEVTQAVFEKLIEPTLINPTFVTHAPKELIPLAKLSPDDPTAVEVMASTGAPTVTLISCYPYLVDKKRIAVFARLQN